MGSKVKLFDEPDPEKVKELLDTMVLLAQEGMTTGLELEFRSQTADEVMLMSSRVIVEEGLPDEFFSNPKHGRRRKFLGEMLKLHCPHPPVNAHLLAQLGGALWSTATPF